MKLGSMVRVVALALLLPAMVLADGKSSGAGWEKFDEEDGITVYRRDVAGSPIVALRGEGVVSASIVRVASVLIDTKRATEWIDRLAEIKVLRKTGELEHVEWNHIETPVVMQDRDFVIRAKLERDAKQKKVTLTIRSVSDKKAPKTDYVRGEITYGKFELTSLDHGKKTHVLAEILADPKGSVPKWIVNMFQKSWPHNTIVSLRKQAARKDVKDIPKVNEILTREGFLK